MIDLARYAEQMMTQTRFGKDPKEMFPGFPPTRPPSGSSAGARNVTGEPTDPEQREHEPAWDEKVLQLNEEFQARRLPYAFGGAIALNYRRKPRSTLDIDINVFVPPEEDGAVLEALGCPSDRPQTHPGPARPPPGRRCWP